MQLIDELVVNYIKHTASTDDVRLLFPVDNTEY